MPPTAVTCPHCGSFYTTFRSRVGQWECQDCEERFVSEERVCVVLANSSEWVGGVLDDWPGPIAHEYARLRGLLSQDQLVAAVWQLKDVGEVLIRFPACVMARDVLEHGSDSAFKLEVRRTLLGPPMSMGGWQGLSERLANHITNAATRDAFLAPEVASLFWEKGRRPGGQDTGLNQLAKNLTTWRNRSFGHGAFRADAAEFQRDLTEYLPRLHTELRAHDDAWQTVALQRLDGKRLTGASSLSSEPGSGDQAHGVITEPVELVGREGRKLTLAPYVQLRRCAICTYRDVFLFDWRRFGAREGRDRYGFIDYRAGHGNESPWFNEPELDAEARRLNERHEVGPTTSEDVDAEFIAADVNEMLAQRATSVRYKKPGYLWARLEAFLRENEAGIWWLRAPGHTGKSTFISGLDPRYRGDLGEASLSGDLADIAVVGFYVRREYQTWPAQFAEQIGDQLKERLNVAAGSRAIPQLDLTSADPQGAMVAWLQTMRAAAGWQRLLVFIDGLDELDPGQVPSIADFIPAPSSLPPGIFFVLTSRPLSELPQPVAGKLAGLLSDASVVDIGLDDREYRSLLKAYFDERVSKRREKLQRTGSPHDFTELFNQAIAKSEGRFLYLSYLADRLADESLRLDSLSQLPTGEELFNQFLEEIDKLHAGSTLADYFRRILVQLAAAEEAFEEDRKHQPAIAQESWRGLPLDVLARRVEGNSDGRVSTRLAYALYTLKPTLGSWKGGGGRHANFQLGLQGVGDVIRRRQPKDVTDAHVGLVEALVRRLHEFRADPEDPDLPLKAADRWSLAYVAAHLTCGGAAASIDSRSVEALDDQMEALENEATRLNDVRDSIRWTTRQIRLRETRAGQPSKATHSIWVARAIAYRGYLLEALGDYAGARTDADRAIAILEDVDKAEDDEQWLLLVDILANTYRNRANTRAAVGDIEGAVHDQSAEIAIREAAAEAHDRDALGPDLLMQLSMALTHRGSRLVKAGAIKAGIEDFKRAAQAREHWLALVVDQEVPFDDLGFVAGDIGEAANALASADNLPAAIKWHDRAVEWLEGLTRRSPGSDHQLVGFLADQYAARAGTLIASGEIALALADYGRAIDSIDRLAPKGAHAGYAEPAMAEELARIYVLRGSALLQAGEVDSSISDHGRAIEVLDRLQASAGSDASSDFFGRRVFALGHRAEALRANGDLAAADQDNRTAIAILESIRVDTGGQLSVDMARTLATLYTNLAIHHIDSGDVTEAIRHYGQAIAVGEQLRGSMGDQWSGLLASELAATYIYRGMAYRLLEDEEHQRADDECALEMYETSMADVTDELEAELAGRFATLYASRAVARGDSGLMPQAVGDFGRAIDIHLHLRESLGDEWSDSLALELALTYINRGTAHRVLGDDSDRRLDGRHAKQILEPLRAKMGNDWPSSSQELLETAHMLGET